VAVYNEVVLLRDKWSDRHGRWWTGGEDGIACLISERSLGVPEQRMTQANVDQVARSQKEVDQMDDGTINHTKKSLL
jgi:hypothetical protein